MKHVRGKIVGVVAAVVVADIAAAVETVGITIAPEMISLTAGVARAGKMFIMLWHPKKPFGRSFSCPNGLFFVIVCPLLTIRVGLAPA